MKLKSCVCLLVVFSLFSYTFIFRKETTHHKTSMINDPDPEFESDPKPKPKPKLAPDYKPPQMQTQTQMQMQVSKNLSNLLNFAQIPSFEERLKYYLTNEFYDHDEKLEYLLSELKKRFDFKRFENTKNRSNFPVDHQYALSLYYNANADAAETTNASSLSATSKRVKLDISQIYEPSMHEKIYLYEVVEYLEKFPNCSLIVQFGDYTHHKSINFPTVMKARRINHCENTTLLKLTKDRHWGFWSKVNRDDIAFANKSSKVVWRGANTNRPLREQFVRQYFHSKYDEFLDIAFAVMHPLEASDYAEVSDVGRAYYTVVEQLQFKYVVSIEGNDVATNLGWILYSNSVPFVALPLKRENWLMHGLLQPYVHYVPFNISRNDSLVRAYRFCESHVQNCSQISRNGKAWMRQFEDPKIEQQMQSRVIQEYCKRVK